MKLLVFAHIPPPHHGQSYMVRLMLAGFGGDHRKPSLKRKAPLEEELPSLDPDVFGIDCYHVDARLSHNLEDIGDIRLGKFILLLGYCLQAIWCRFRHGVTNLYYVPAPGKASALYRDWLVMLICRPFFKRIILHWHAAGLAKWLETVVQMRSRSLTYKLAKPVDVSIVLSQANRGDGEKLFSRRVQVVNNGIPDPCSDFETKVLPLRHARFIARKKLLAGEHLSGKDLEAAGSNPEILKVLFLAHCTRQKGLFDALDAVEILNRRLMTAKSPLRVHLTVAGDFINNDEQREFERRIARPEQAQNPAASEPSEQRPPTRQPWSSCYWTSYKGFVYGEEKARLLTESDCFCFPTFYYAESFGLVIVEAMAFGLPIITTKWRSIPELLPTDYPGLVDIKSPSQIADRLIDVVANEPGEGFRGIFLQNFTIEKHLSALAAAIRSAEEPEASLTRSQAPAPAR